MEIKYKNTESFKIGKGVVAISTNVFKGKENETFVVISPSFLVSGYGQTMEEAEESFQDSMEVFCEDMLALTPEELKEELNKLGFFESENEFSKMIVDSKGELLGFDIYNYSQASLTLSL